MTQRRTLDPKLDVVFTMLFGAEKNRDILLAFLTAVLVPASPIESVQILSERPEPSNVDDKRVVLDLRVRFESGEQVDVEMQNEGHPGIKKRALYYWARMYAGGQPRGAEYEDLSRCVVIFVANFRMLDSPRYHSIFRSMEVTTGELLTDDYELHVLELPKLPQAPAANSEPADVLWGKFFTAKTDLELEQLAMQEPALKRAKEALEDLSDDPVARAIAEKRETNLRMHYVTLAAMRREAVAEATPEIEARGQAVGEARGQAVGEARGQAIAAISAVLMVLAARGLAVSTEAEQRVRSETDLPTLTRWIARAATIERAELLFEEP
jgi:predicted transposase/invertase (TIGR01784 family)